MDKPEDLVAEIEALGATLRQARAMVARRIIGQDEVVELTLSAMLAGGHALLIGLPGLGKTRLVETLGTVMGLDDGRIQFTPDLMPSDILGSEVLEEAGDGTRSFRFLPGPVFCQLLLADEINRASPRTQSALLQAMQEREITVAGVAHRLDAPFHVLATQNPLEQEGTYPLPEAQLDRFLLQIDVGYPDRDAERAILMATTGAEEAAAGAEAAASMSSALSPSSSSTAIGSLTLTPSVPSPTRILPMVPSSTASNSIVALSVSISASTSPEATLSPSFTSHLASVPSSIVGLSAGIRI